MKKILNYMKKNMLFSVLLILFILIFILGIVAMKVLIFPSYGASKYGDRLNGMENVNITDNSVNEVVSKVETKEGINYKSYRLSGKIVNIYFDIDDSVSNDDIKGFANTFVGGFSDDQLAYYDFQVFVKKNDECVLIGYRNKNATELSWNHVGEN